MAIVTTSQNITAVTYAQGEIIEIRNGATLTISASPAIRPGTVQCITSGKLRIENSSATVPLIFDLHDMDHDLRFEAGGVLEIRGAPMSLASGTGTATTASGPLPGAVSVTWAGTYANERLGVRVASAPLNIRQVSDIRPLQKEQRG